jgi:hypothetical protein
VRRNFGLFTASKSAEKLKGCDLPGAEGDEKTSNQRTARSELPAIYADCRLQRKKNKKGMLVFLGMYLPDRYSTQRGSEVRPNTATYDSGECPRSQEQKTVRAIVSGNMAVLNWTRACIPIELGHPPQF